MRTKLELLIVADTKKDFFDPINAPLLEAFTQFLVSEFSNENMLFAKAVRDFKASAPYMTTQAQMDAKVLEIYNQYVSETAPSQININKAARESVRGNLNSADVNIFDSPFKQVEALMSRDSLRRFIVTQAYQDAVQEIEPVQKEYDALNHAYQNEPENNRSNFVAGLLKQQAADLEKAEKNILKYSTGNILVKNNKKLELANAQKQTVLIRAKAVDALVINRLNPDLEIESAKKKVKLSQDALDLAESNLAHVAEFDSVEKGDISSLKMANQEVDYAQYNLNEAIKKLDDLMNESEHPAMPAITPMLAQSERGHKAHFNDGNKMNNANETKADDTFAPHRPRR